MGCSGARDGALRAVWLLLTHGLFPPNPPLLHIFLFSLFLPIIAPSEIQYGYHLQLCYEYIIGAATADARAPSEQSQGQINTVSEHFYAQPRALFSLDLADNKLRLC